ncbi:MAG: hypothetical protein EOO12_15285, partial [Chitinophagaceae bacterium]
MLALFLASCATYNQQVSSYYGHYRQGDYQKASAALDDSKLLSKRRNHLLFLLEKGRMEHLLHHYEASNRYFNEADNLMEDGGNATVGDFALATLLNPMMETYRGEDFEKYMVHYYKALNYLMLNEPAEAMVEARRISLRTYAQEDVRGEHKYAQDAFSFMLQGLIYEKNKDLNNAFIAYRNAADLYLKNGGSYYGVAIPLQLKKDLLRTAWQMGFQDQVEFYQRELGYTLQPEDRATGPELVLFWEAGSAPVKEEENIMFFLSKQGSDFFFTSANGSLRVPFDRSMGSVDEGGLANISAIRAALPRYELQACAWQSAEARTDSNSAFAFEPAQSINDLAQNTLRERRLRDLSKTLTRIALGKLAEIAAAPKDKPKDKEETEEEKRKRRNAELLAAGIKIFNFAKEKADTRNWQSLPGSIYYTRVPLKTGPQTVKVSVKGSYGEKTYELP